MKEKFIKYYLEIAELTSKLSHANKLKVGAVIVKENQILSTGYNGTPAGWDNNCEDEIIEVQDGMMLISENEIRYLKTKPEVIHAERNAIDKVAASHESTQNSIMFCTHSPCLECSKSIYSSGISKVFYRNTYRSDDGINFLKKCGVDITQII